MSARVEAAAKGVWGIWDELDENEQDNARDMAVSVLHSADSVMFSEAAIERAARALANLPGNIGWEQESPQYRQRYLDDVSAVVAALREGE